MNCPYCNAPLEDEGGFCGRCGSELSPAQKKEPPPAREPGPERAEPRRPDRTGPSPHVHVHVHQEESVAFAVVTLLAWLFLPPVGLIMNIVGLVTGPKKGCFWWMFIVLFLVPGVLCVALVVFILLLGVGMAAAG